MTLVNEREFTLTYLDETYERHQEIVWAKDFVVVQEQFPQQHPGCEIWSLLETKEQRIRDAVERFAWGFLDEDHMGSEISELLEMGLQPTDWAHWNIDPRGHVQFTIKDVTIKESEEYEGKTYWYVVVDAAPEAPDKHLFEVCEDRYGYFEVKWMDYECSSPANEPAASLAVA